PPTPPLFPYTTLFRSDRARSRGGPLAASALLERAALLTTDPGRRADRTLSAAAAKRNAGALEAALALLPAVEAQAPSDLRRALRSEEHTSELQSRFDL